MKTLKIIGGMLFVAAFLAVSLLPSDSFAKTKLAGKTEHINLQVSGMMCPYCSSSLETCLGKLKGAENIKANYSTGRASLDVPASSQVTKDQLMKAVKNAGFKLVEVKFLLKPETVSATRQVSQ